MQESATLAEVTVLSTHIAALLMEHDCVIVPHFGGFIANAVSAQHNQVTHKFTPPSRKFSFNSHLKHNDGLLIHSLAEKNDITYQESEQIVQDEVANWNQQLKAGERLNLEELGYLRQTQDGRLIFEPNTTKANSKASFGLETFHRMPISPAPKKKDEPANIQPAVEAAPRKRNWSYVAAALALPIVGYMGYVATQTGLFKADQQFAVAELNPFASTYCALYEERGIMPVVGTIPETEENWLQLTSDKDVVPLYLTNDHSDESAIWVRLNHAKALMEESANIHLIAGCFGNEINAKNLVEDLKIAGYPASIIDYHKGLYRVSASGFSTRKKAEEALSSIRTSVAPSAWLLIK
jgi:nucleoid DNA-binding protein